MELITTKCPVDDCTNVIVLEILERGEGARFEGAHVRRLPGPRGPTTIDVVRMSCPDGHDFKVAFRSLHQTRFISE